VPPKKVTVGLNHIPTHRETTCTACRLIAVQLNTVIDKLSSEMQVSSNGSLVGPEAAAADYQQYQVLLAALEACERSCPPIGHTTGYIDPPITVIIERKTDEDHRTGENRRDENRKDEYRKDESKKSDVVRPNPTTDDRKPKTVNQEKTTKTDVHKPAATRASQEVKGRSSISRQMKPSRVNASRFSAPRQNGFGGMRGMTSSPSRMGGMAPRMGSFGRMSALGGMRSFRR